MFVNSPEERQSDQPTCVPTMLSACKAELEEVSGHGRDQHRTRKQTSNPRASSNQRETPWEYQMMVPT